MFSLQFQLSMCTCMCMCMCVSFCLFYKCSSKLRGAALQSLFTLARNYDNGNWSDHVEEALTLLLAEVEVLHFYMYMYRIVHVFDKLGLAHIIPRPCTACERDIVVGVLVKCFGIHVQCVFC